MLGEPFAPHQIDLTRLVLQGDEGDGAGVARALPGRWRLITSPAVLIRAHGGTALTSRALSRCRAQQGQGVPTQTEPQVRVVGDDLRLLGGCGEQG